LEDLICLYDTFATRRLYILARDKKGKLVMFPKLALIFIMGVALVGAAAAATPIPVLVALGILVIAAFLATVRQGLSG
jgi:hypothetical protein